MGGYYYITKAGDMWDYIAWKAYGTERMAGTLYGAPENRELLSVYIFSAGVKVWCPYVDVEETAEEMPDWRDAE